MLTFKVRKKCFPTEENAAADLDYTDAVAFPASKLSRLTRPFSPMPSPSPAAAARGRSRRPAPSRRGHPRRAKEEKARKPR